MQNTIATTIQVQVRPAAVERIEQKVDIVLLILAIVGWLFICWWLAGKLTGEK